MEPDRLNDKKCRDFLCYKLASLFELLLQPQEID